MSGAFKEEGSYTLLIERAGDGEVVEISFGEVTLRAPRASDERRALGVSEGRRAMKAFAEAILALPGIELQRKPGVPLFYLDKQYPALLIRELDGIKQRGRLEDGHFVEVSVGPHGRGQARIPGA